MKSFLFIRHGQTDWNKENKLMGQQNIPLNETGRKQALEAAQKISKFKISKVFSSPLLRANQTAQIISTQLKIKYVILPGFTEYSWGDCEGTIMPNSPVTHFLINKNTINSNISVDEFKSNVLKALNTATNTPPPLPLIIGHGVTFWAITDLLLNKGQDLSNPQIVLFKEQNKHWVLETI